MKTVEFIYWLFVTAAIGLLGGMLAAWTVTAF